MNIKNAPTIAKNHLSSWLNILYKSPFQEEVDNKLNKSILDFDNHESDVGNKSKGEEDACQSIVSKVNSDGYVILPSVFSGEILESFKSEFRKIIDSAENSTYQVDRKGDTTCVRVEHHDKHDFKIYPATSAFFNSTILKDITKVFYKDSENGFDFNTEIFVHETPETNNPISEAMHWDRAQTLKFWVYVDDLPVEAGPMMIETGTVEKNKATRIDKHTSKKVLIGGVDNILEVDESNVIPLSAPAGSVMIHDTDASHGASKVMPGYVRRIMRGHCRAKK